MGPQNLKTPTGSTPKKHKKLSRLQKLEQFDQFSRAFGKEVEHRGISEKQLIKDVKKTQQEVLKERYGSKGSVVARTAGIFKTDQPPLTAEELREAGERAIAEDVSERMEE